LDTARLKIEAAYMKGKQILMLPFDTAEIQIHLELHALFDEIVKIITIMCQAKGKMTGVEGYAALIICLRFSELNEVEELEVYDPQDCFGADENFSQRLQKEARENVAKIPHEKITPFASKIRELLRDAIDKR
jgi:hypothetical protein